MPPALLKMPPPLGGAVAGEGAVGDRERAAVRLGFSLKMPPPSRRCCRRRCCWSPSACRRCRCRRRCCEGAVAGEGAVGDRQRAVVVDAAAAMGAVAGEGAVGYLQRAFVVDAAAEPPEALLPEKVLLVTVSVPLLEMPPPPSSPEAIGDRRVRDMERSS